MSFLNRVLGQPLDTFTADQIIEATAFLIQVVDIVDRNITNQAQGTGQESQEYIYDEDYTPDQMAIDLHIPSIYGDACFVDDFAEAGFSCFVVSNADDQNEGVTHIRVTASWEQYEFHI